MKTIQCPRCKKVEIVKTEIDLCNDCRQDRIIELYDEISRKLDEQEELKKSLI